MLELQGLLVAQSKGRSGQASEKAVPEVMQHRRGRVLHQDSSEHFLARRYELRMSLSYIMEALGNTEMNSMFKYGIQCCIR